MTPLGYFFFFTFPELDLERDEEDDFLETFEDDFLELERETLLLEVLSFEDELREELFSIDFLSPVIYLKMRFRVESELFVFEDRLLLIFGEEGYPIFLLVMFLSWLEVEVREGSFMTVFAFSIAFTSADSDFL